MTRRYTDQTLTLLVKNRDLRNSSGVYITISQYTPEDVIQNTTSASFYSGTSYDKTELTLQAKSVSYSNPNSVVLVDLTQEQNALFKEGYVRIQINWIDSSHKRKATVVKRLRHHENLHEEVIS